MIFEMVLVAVMESNMKDPGSVSRQRSISSCKLPLLVFLITSTISAIYNTHVYVCICVCVRVCMYSIEMT